MEFYPSCSHIQDVLFTCTQRVLDGPVPALMINICISASDHCILFAQEPVMFIFCGGKNAAIFASGKNETAVAYCRLSTIKCQHGVARMAYPPCFEQREKRVTTDIKPELPFGLYQAVRCDWWNRLIITELHNYYTLLQL